MPHTDVAAVTSWCGKIRLNCLAFVSLTSAHECSSSSPWEQEAQFPVRALMSGLRLREVQRARRRGEEPREWARDGGGEMTWEESQRAPRGITRRLLIRTHANEVLGHWIEHTNAVRRLRPQLFHCQERSDALADLITNRLWTSR